MKVARNAHAPLRVLSKSGYRESPATQRTRNDTVAFLYREESLTTARRAGRERRLAIWHARTKARLVRDAHRIRDGRGAARL